MICLRCGNCCKYLWVVIVDDPEKGPVEENLIEHKGLGVACKHLRGNQAGDYWCAIHRKPWYQKTPCAWHGQIERSPDTECRMGRYILDKAEQVKA